MANILGPIANVTPGLPGGTHAAYNVTAAGLLNPTSGLLQSVGCITAGTITLNDANALVTAQTITAITVASAAVVTVSTGASNPFALGNTIAFASVGGMTQINAVTGLVTAIGGSSGAWTVTTNINSSAFSAYTSGGTAASYSAANEIDAYVMTTGQAPIDCVGWPCINGLLVSAVSAGVFSVAFTY
jgi:hypothetical protein